MRFDRAYTQYPLCNPSRTSLLTGRYPTQTGVMDNETWFRAEHPDFVSLPQHFKARGYATLRAGKIFHGGIDDTDAWTEGGEARNFTGARRPPKHQSGRIAPRNRIASWSWRERENRTAITGRRRGRLNIWSGAKTAHSSWLSDFAKPHSPPAAPKKFFDLYDPAKLRLPPDFAPRPAAPPGFPEISIPRRNADLFIGRDASETEAREMIRAYYASVSFMDAQVGRVLDALDRLKLRDKTIIVFWGDHGYHLGEKGKWSKAYSLYEVGARVPLIIAAPQMKAGVSGRTVQLLDLYPTLVELCGLPRLPGIEGHSLTPLLRNPRAKWSHPAFTVTRFQDKIGKSVRTERWHYVEWDDGKAGAMLFDHSRDPFELKNLADDPAFARQAREMKLLLKRLPSATVSANNN